MRYGRNSFWKSLFNDVPDDAFHKGEPLEDFEHVETAFPEIAVNEPQWALARLCEIRLERNFRMRRKLGLMRLFDVGLLSVISLINILY